MDDERLRRANQRVGLWVLAGMVALAVAATVLMLATQAYRRQVDIEQPILPSLRENAASVAIFVLVGGAIGFVWMRIRRGK